MIKVGVVGLGFGAEFIPIYQRRHPDIEVAALCRRDEAALHSARRGLIALQLHAGEAFEIRFQNAKLEVLD